MIVLDEKIVGLWFLSLTHKSDWLAGIRELVAEEKYELVYRVRYYEDEKVFESDDKKNWYRGELSGTRHYVVESFRQVAQHMNAIARGPLFEYMNEGDLREFMKRLQDAPFMFLRAESIKGAE